MSAEENKAIFLRALEEVWSQGKLEVIDEIFAANYVYHKPGFGEVRGPEGLKQNVSMIRTALPDLKLKLEDQIAEGDKVVNRWTWTATHKGELMGIPPTGVQVTVTGIDIGHIVEGKIVEEWGSADLLGLMQQLGVVPPPGQPEK